MTSSEVPEASFIGKPRASTSIGTTMNPPPTPKKPVRKPVKVAAAATTSSPRRAEALSFSLPPPSSGLFRERSPRTSMTTPTTASITQNSVRRRVPSTATEARDPTSAPSTLMSPKVAPSRQCTRPARAGAMRETIAVSPTTTSDPAEASCGSWPSR